MVIKGLGCGPEAGGKWRRYRMCHRCGSFVRLRAVANGGKAACKRVMSDGCSWTRMVSKASDGRDINDISWLTTLDGRLASKQESKVADETWARTDAVRQREVGCALAGQANPEGRLV